MAKKFINIVLTFTILVLQSLLFMQVTMADQSTVSNITECPKKCGDFSIPYPFGIGPNCSLQGFMLTCNKTNNGTFLPLFGNQTLLNVSLTLGQLRVNNPISSQCYNSTINADNYTDWTWNIYKSQFQFNHEKNKFTVIGCDTLAYLSIYDRSWFRGGCVSGCNSFQSLTNGSCSGIGCCQTTIPRGTNYYQVRFDENFNNSQVYSFSRCGYAVLMEDAGFEFNTRYITTDYLYKREMPVVLDWTIGNQTCEIAKINKSSYACVSKNSLCVDSWNYSGALGYLCNCSAGYEGNPYVVGGCHDINECTDGESICGDKNCRNTLGSYECSCRSGTHTMSGSNGACIPKLALWVKLVIGICVGLMVILLSSSYTYMANERRKLAKIKEKYFQQYGGRLLLEEMKSKHGPNFTIFSVEELKEATDNFDENSMIGEGGNGTVYKGTLKNDSAVAIKRCKTIDERQKKEFGKEMLILSQINHINIVRIRGCCLEVEIPILVYEFISNGTLSNLIHAKHASRISLGTRLRIAKEAAEALAYLHSWAFPPIVHRDVKSSNILLDENFMAKVSDFGASVLAPVDQDACFTVVQGTRGYLDPEYLQSGQLTVKSDVYSFGVVLLELLTCQKAFSFGVPEEERSLSSRFLSAMKDNKLEEILDDDIVNEEDLGLIKEVAKLAKGCLNLDGEKRPEMKEVAEELVRLGKSMKHPWGRDNREEMESLLGEAESSNTHEIEMTGYYSLEKKAMLVMESGR